MSALPPKADLLGGHEKCPLLTQSGHSSNCAIEQERAENQGFPFRLRALSFGFVWA